VARCLRIALVCAALLPGWTAPARSAGVPWCPRAVGVEAFGPGNQGPRGVAVSGSRAFTADLYGLTVYDISDPTAIRKVGEALLPDRGSEVAVVGDLALVAAGSEGLQIVDVGTPMNPVVAGSLDLEGVVSHLAAEGATAFVAVLRQRLVTVDLTDPARPAVLGSLVLEGIQGIAVSGDHLVAALDSGALAVVDVSDPANPTLRATLELDEPAYGVALAGTLAAVDGVAALHLVDLSDPAHPRETGAADLNEWGNSVAISGSLAAVAAFTATDLVDISDPANPRLLASLPAPGRANGVAMDGSLLLVADSLAGLVAYDATTPSAPVLEDLFHTDGWAAGIAVEDGVACIANENALVTLDTRNPAHPSVLGEYPLGHSAWNLARTGDLVFVTDRDGMTVLDVGDPSNPRVLSRTIQGAGSPVAAVPGLVVTSGYSNGWALGVLDVSDPADPVFMGSVALPDLPYDITASGHLAAVICRNAELLAVDLSAHTSPSVLSALPLPENGSRIVLAGNTAYVADGGTGLVTVDLSDAVHPRIVSTLRTSAWAVEVAVAGDRAFVTGFPHALDIVDVGNPEDPYVMASIPLAQYPFGVAFDPSNWTAWVTEGAIVESVDVSCLGCPRIEVSVDPSPVPTDTSATVTVTLRSSAGTPVAGREVTASHRSISAFTDLGDGRYTAVFHGTTQPGWIEFGISVDGTSCDATGAIHVVPGPSPTLDGVLPVQRLLIPAAAHVQGAHGTVWRTDAVLHNPTGREAVAELFLLEEGRDNRSAPGKVVTVPPRSSLALDDLVGGALARPGAVGAVLVAADRALLATSRTYNDAPSGTYGQFIPGLGSGALQAGGTPVRLLQLTRNAGYRTNVGLVNLADTSRGFDLTFHGADGAVVGSRSVTVPAEGFLQLEDPVGTDLPDGWATVTPSSGSGSYFAYASVVDNRTGDPVFVTPALEEAAPGSSVFVAGSAHVHGVAGTDWRTDLELHNPGTGVAQYTRQLLPEGGGAPTQSVTGTLAAGRSLRLEDVLMSAFGFEGTASLRIAPQVGSLTATSRTYNTTPEGTYGQFIPALSAGPGTWRPLLLLGLAENDRYRTNIGLLNPGDGTIHVVVELFSSTGRRLGLVRETLGPHAYVQKNRIFREVTPDDLSGASATVHVEDFREPVMVYASVVDNRSGDPVYVLPELHPADPTEIVLSNRRNAVLVDELPGVEGTDELPGGTWRATVGGAGDLGRSDLPIHVVCLYKTPAGTLRSAALGIGQTLDRIGGGFPFRCFIPDWFDASDNHGGVDVTLTNGSTTLVYHLDAAANCVLLDALPASVRVAGPMPDYAFTASGDLGATYLPPNVLALYRSGESGELRAEALRPGQHLQDLDGESPLFLVVLDWIDGDDNTGESVLRFNGG